ncbi:hypothetical protein KFE25_002154 [Diacronema lutheri]|uniref:Uncharacterized protein n=1 Tax=Diacronema lutheri TaxID=2081491 RepID=A0A8J5XG08_DIALT|nr:hypothetical protein KFE25_002154 [Diacronema lutheri]
MRTELTWVVFLVVPTCASRWAPAGGIETARVAPNAAPASLPRHDTDGALAPSKRTRARESLRAAVVLGWLQAVWAAYTPTEHWLRRAIGGERQQRAIWGEYCAQRDALVQQTATDRTPSAMKAAVLTRRIDDLRAELRARYPAWAVLFQ